MDPRRVPVIDSSLSLLVNGYSWLPSRWRRSTLPVVHARLMGKHTVALRGPDAVPFFYDERNLRRRDAVPGPVLDTLFGRGAVHTMDGEAHRVRKAMFLSVLTDPDRIAALIDQAERAWDDAVKSWAARSSVDLFDEVSRVITRAVCRWAGVPLPDHEVDERARDFVATIDGFATAGPRHWRARRARGRLERWISELISSVRDGAIATEPGSVVDVVSRHRDADGQPLDPRTAAVEVLNVVRPTVAVTWYVTFAAHAMHRWPHLRDRLREGGPDYAEAFTHELRRFYPFVPFVGGRAVADRRWKGEPIPAEATVLLDVYGQHHDADVFPSPYEFDPDRFLGRPIGPNELIPQGGGDPATGHRCPGEDITVELIKTFASRLSELAYTVPEQDVRIPFTRMPPRVRSGFVIADVRTASH